MQRLAPRMVVRKGGKCSKKERMGSNWPQASEKMTACLPRTDLSRALIDLLTHGSTRSTFYQVMIKLAVEWEELESVISLRFGGYPVRSIIENIMIDDETRVSESFGLQVTSSR